MVARAVSTIIGTLFFVMIASMLILLIIRSLYIYGELASKLRNVMETRDLSSDLTIQVSYSKLEPVTASTVTTIEVLQGHPINADPTLLDSRDGECVQVEAESASAGGEGIEVQLIRNGDFSEGLNHWNYTGPWEIIQLDDNKAAHYSYTGKKENSSSIWQNFTLNFMSETTLLSFRYLSVTEGKPKRFTLTVRILKDSYEVFVDTINLLKTPQNDSYYNIGRLEPGNYKIRFDIYMQSKRGKVTTFNFTLDDVSLLAQAPTPPSPPGAAYTVLIKISIAQIGLGVNGTLTLRFNDTVNLKVFIWAEDRWQLSEEDVGLPGRWFNTTLCGDSLLQAYSTRPFLTELDYLALTAEITTKAKVIAVNEDERRAEVYAAWLRNSTWEARIARHAVLFPGESITFQFNTTLTPGCEYEVRIVTTTRVVLKTIKP